ncbi:lipase maturation factor family protein [Rhodococcus sp. D2-41]|uniref:lipase maturation factor family protein n=1 Tax=Speluncibacter jeojiensis TaxID=2710754 RepID=UPI00240FD8B7|nr:lipase maturation factor family protein [Rhodococcus sp. D2-41]MDG3012917.1 lipase maturation factor family protein [Rhodococcus sp. D2-41]
MDWIGGGHLGRWLFTEGLAVLYLVAFVAAARQFRALLGSRGMLPIPRFLSGTTFWRSPSIFCRHYSDRFFAAVAWTGAALALVTVAGVTARLPLPACMAVWLVLWALYLSIVNVGQLWYSFGWESLLLEAGFLAVFVGNASTPPPVAILLLLRWLLLRVEFGAGLIKIRGDPCWRNLTCLYYHHETQPMPGPLSWYFHRLPRPLHRVEAAGNHLTQLVVPFGLFAPQPGAGIAAAIMIVTQVWLVASGNFAWLNWLTIVLACSVIPDSLLPGAAPTITSTPLWFTVVTAAVTAGIALLSYRPVRNLLSHHQLMNASFEPWHLVNTYGAFGHITKVRTEIVVEGTDDAVVTPATRWREYEFRGKPGAPERRPRQYAPYHLRLDWLMWFAAISPGYGDRWFGGFVRRLLENDPDTLRLLRRNPFPDLPPHFVRARLYEYRFTDRRTRRATGRWWDREPISVCLPPVDLARFGGR